MALHYGGIAFKTCWGRQSGRDRIGAGGKAQGCVCKELGVSNEGSVARARLFELCINGNWRQLSRSTV
jgi:hypothetical protein